MSFYVQYSGPFYQTAEFGRFSMVDLQKRIACYKTCTATAPLVIYYFPPTYNVGEKSISVLRFFPNAAETLLHLHSTSLSYLTILLATILPV